MFTDTKTDRGFQRFEFTDAYGNKCSLQESSSYTPRIWLGIDDPNPEIMNSDAKKLGLPRSGETGWTKFDIPKQVLLHTRMHLNKKQVISLVEKLQEYLETMPELEEDEEE